MSQDFDEILNQWESRENKQKSVRRKQDSAPSAGWLDMYPPDDRIRDSRGIETGPSPVTAKLRKYEPPQAQIDLHGMTVEEAQRAAEAFLRESSRRGLRKVLIIHGKGYHSPGGKPVLKKQIRFLLETSPLVGKFGSAERVRGGEGATWVILRSKERN